MGLVVAANSGIYYFCRSRVEIGGRAPQCIPNPDLRLTVSMLSSPEAGEYISGCKGAVVGSLLCRKGQIVTTLQH